MRLRGSADVVDYAMRRHSAPWPVFRVRYKLGGPLGVSRPGTLEHFLIERYLLHVERGPTLWIVQVHHSPYSLQRARMLELQDELIRQNDRGKMPILYVCLFDKENVYCAGAPGAIPVPEVNEKALVQLGLHGTTQGGPSASPLKITEREFGWGAARVPKLGADVGVVVLRSEI